MRFGRDGGSLLVPVAWGLADGVYVRETSAAAEPDDLHAAAAQRAGVFVPEDPLPRCVPQGRSRVENQLVGSKGASGCNLYTFVLFEVKL